jgi:hypothetical protein
VNVILYVILSFEKIVYILKLGVILNTGKYYFRRTEKTTENKPELFLAVKKATKNKVFFILND